MREILFRGKSIDDDTWAADVGDWVYGGYVPPANKHLNKYFIGNMGICTKVNPETIGQFTGLTDKNGKKIFEGDILKPHTCRGTRIYTVDWCSDCAMFVLPCITNEKWETDFVEYCSEDFEIIGNVHDNPELMKGEENE